MRMFLLTSFDIMIEEFALDDIAQLHVYFGIVQVALSVLDLVLEFLRRLFREKYFKLPCCQQK